MWESSNIQKSLTTCIWTVFEELASLRVEEMEASRDLVWPLFQGKEAGNFTIGSISYLWGRQDQTQQLLVSPADRQLISLQSWPPQVLLSHLGR